MSKMDLVCSWRYVSLAEVDRSVRILSSLRSSFESRSSTTVESVVESSASPNGG